MMGIYKNFKQFRNEAILTFSLIMTLNSCNNPDADSKATSQETFLKGVVKSEQRNDGLYQVTIGDHNRRYGGMFDPAPETYDIRFYENNFNLDSLDKKINTGNELELVVVNVGNVLESKKNWGYHWRAVAINKIE